MRVQFGIGVLGVMVWQILATPALAYAPAHPLFHDAPPRHYVGQYYTTLDGCRYVRVPVAIAQKIWVLVPKPGKSGPEKCPITLSELRER